MRFSLNWLKKHLDTDLNLQQIAEKMTSIGLEVEEVLDPAIIFKNFKLVEIIEIENHPNADKLHLCTVKDAKGTTVRIVCGAQNVRVGLKTILAMEGAFIPEGQFILKKNKIRGVVSEGMMCSREELNLPKKEDGIIDLPETVTLDTPVGDVLGYEGGIIDVSLTPDRGDCFSVRGIARDLAAAGAGKLIETKEIKCKSTDAFPLTFRMDQSPVLEKCIPHAAFRVIRNIQNSASPDWLKNDLMIAGINSISLIVDLANWLMIDRGRPLHIYDLDKIEGDFHIRLANEKEEFVDLKDNKHALRDDIVVPTDDNDILCIFGVMGSKKTACTMETKNILVESALFDPVFISKTGGFLNIVSDSRTRFERGIDTASCVCGIEDITKLIMDNCGGSCSDIYKIGNIPVNNKTVKICKDHLENVGGCNIAWAVALKILEDLGLKNVRSTDSEAELEIPSWRADLVIEEDLIAEILRIYGFENISERPLETWLVGNDEKWNEIAHEMSIRRLLTFRQLSEVITYSFIKDDLAKEFSNEHKLIYLLNPISIDMNTMRPSLIPGLISSALRSLNFGKNSAKLFEIGHVFYEDCEQHTHISGIRIGEYNERHWLNKSRNADVFDVKADAMAVLQFCGISENSISFENKAPEYYHPYRSAAITRGKNVLGYFGELKPSVAQIFGISARVECFELHLDEFISSRAKRIMFSDKVFPKINRDFAFIFDKKMSMGSLIRSIGKIDRLITNVSIFDRFEMDNGRVSIGISVSFEATDRTLTENDAQQVSDKIIKFVESKGGELRSK